MYPHQNQFDLTLRLRIALHVLEKLDEVLEKGLF